MSSDRVSLRHCISAFELHTAEKKTEEDFEDLAIPAYNKVSSWLEAK